MATSLDNTAESGLKRELQLREVALRNELKRRRLQTNGSDKKEVKTLAASQGAATLKCIQLFYVMATGSHIHFGTPVPAACHNEVPSEGLVNGPSSLMSEDATDHFVAIPGQILNNHYTIMAKLGRYCAGSAYYVTCSRGVFATVYHCQYTSMPSSKGVAIKVTLCVTFSYLIL